MDEKVYGTIHIAFGNNMSFGGSVEVPIHIDCVITNPTITVGKRKIIDGGKFLAGSKGF